MKERDVLILVNFSDNFRGFQAASFLEASGKTLHLLIIQVESTLSGFLVKGGKACASLEPYLGKH